MYFFIDPGETAWFPRCPFYVLTGVKCPGCGSQRALHQLLHLHLGEALRQNALLVLSIPVLCLYGGSALSRDKAPRLYGALRKPAAGWVLFAAILLWWIGRNALGL